MDLSQKRADAVVNALIKKGVPNKMLKAKGVGAKISYASQKCIPNENTRKEIVKIIVQIITNMDYWNIYHKKFPLYQNGIYSYIVEYSRFAYSKEKFEPCIPSCPHCI